jgi:hypothetical protein
MSLKIPTKPSTVYATRRFEVPAYADPVQKTNALPALDSRPLSQKVHF